MSVQSHNLTVRELREEVLEANMDLLAYGLVQLTSGNASGIDREQDLMVIKPSGVPYDRLRAEDMVVVSIDSGEVLAGERPPSSDTPTHLALYRAWAEIGGIVHTHSAWATAWAQAGQPIPMLGSTHAGLCAGPVPVTRQLTALEIDRDYEGSTGAALIEALGSAGALDVPCALVRGHAPFCWGASAAGAVESAVMLEQVAQMALLTRLLAPDSQPLAEAMREKDFERKHGTSAYSPAG